MTCILVTDYEAVIQKNDPNKPVKFFYKQFFCFISRDCHKIKIEMKEFRDNSCRQRLGFYIIVPIIVSKVLRRSKPRFERLTGFHKSWFPSIDRLSRLNMFKRSRRSHGNPSDATQSVENIALSG